MEYFWCFLLMKNVKCTTGFVVVQQCDASIPTKFANIHTTVENKIRRGKIISDFKFAFENTRFKDLYSYLVSFFI